MEQATKDEICDFVTTACSSKTNNRLHLGTITLEVALKIKKYVPLTLTNYEIIIDEEHIRHVRNQHQEDLEYICLISEIIIRFDRVFKIQTSHYTTIKKEIFVLLLLSFQYPEQEQNPNNAILTFPQEVPVYSHTSALCTYIFFQQPLHHQHMLLKDS